MSNEAERITSLETKVFAQEDTITELRNQHHEFDIKLVKITSELTRNNELQTVLEGQVTSIYDRLFLMDSELKISFEKRDLRIVDLQIESAKVNTRQLVYASVAFTVITVLIQIGIRLLI